MIRKEESSSRSCLFTVLQYHLQQAQPTFTLFDVGALWVSSRHTSPYRPPALKDGWHSGLVGQIGRVAQRQTELSACKS
jgi:hypothetical protein